MGDPLPGFKLIKFRLFVVVVRFFKFLFHRLFDSSLTISRQISGADQLFPTGYLRLKIMAVFVGKLVKIQLITYPDEMV